MLSFQLNESFIEDYVERDVAWGDEIFSQLVFLRTYSRKKLDGTKEHWYETCRRVIEGTFSIQKDHVLSVNTPWDEEKAQRSAMEMYDLMFNFKWWPPGRGIENMGTDGVNGWGYSDKLYSCAFQSTWNLEKHPIAPFTKVMSKSMRGVGCGFDTKGSGYSIKLQKPTGVFHYDIPDTTEGWVDSLGALLRAYILGTRLPHFTYDRIRPAGSPINSGGLAPGPEPLSAMHSKVSEILDSRVGEGITSRTIVDLMNLIGKAVASGGRRRSALIALGFKEDDDFVHLKDWTRPENAERVAKDGWAWSSNNTISLRSTDNFDYDWYAERQVQNGEPGLFFSDMVTNYGRIDDGFKRDADPKATGTNPCLPGFANVVTPDGIRKLDDVNPGDSIWSKEGWTTVVDKWVTGIKDVYEFETTGGRFIGTPEHRVVSRGSKLEVKDATSLDIVQGDTSIVGMNEDAVVDGLVIGDGSVHGASNNKVYLCIGENDGDYFLDSVSSHIGEKLSISDYAYLVDTTIKAEELPKTWDRVVPDRYYYSKPEDVAGFLRGIYSANGSVVADGRRVTLKTTSVRLLKQVQDMLQTLGIRSYYTTNKATSTKHSNGTYESKESYDLNITVDRVLFLDKIGFIQDYKNVKLNTDAAFGYTYQSREIRDETYVGLYKVYDISVDNDTHTFTTGCVDVSNCGEISLEDDEVCNLNTINLMQQESLSDFLRTIKFSYLYSKAVTLLPTSWPETNAVVAQNRRIGCSVSGTAEFVETYGWQELRKWLQAGYKEVRAWDNIYSRWFGVRESIKVTTSKPEGTVSQLTLSTPGVHYPVANTYIRRMQFNVNDPLLGPIKDAGYKIEPAFGDEKNTYVVEFPVHESRIRAEKDVSVYQKMALAVLVQESWSDNMVSCTLSFHPEEKDDLAATLKMNAGKYKGIACLAIDSNSYPQMPYQSIEENQYINMKRELGEIDFDSIYAGAAWEAEAGPACEGPKCAI